MQTSKAQRISKIEIALSFLIVRSKNRNEESKAWNKLGEKK